MSGGSRLGAGRPAWHDKVEYRRSIDIRRWARSGSLERGSYFTRWMDENGQETAAISYTVDSEYQLTLRYSREGDEGKRSFVIPVQLTRTACHYGGSRVWFLCPHCHRRTAKLYLHSEGWACRKSLELVYAIQSECRTGRLTNRLHRLQAKLDHECFRPKGMHHKTYERILEQIEWADNAWAASLSGLLGRLMGKDYGLGESLNR
jgi:hypothetical protein